MLEWIVLNLSTIIISLILAVIVALIIIKIVKGKKKGKSGYGCDCSSCAMHCQCHQNIDIQNNIKT